MIRTTEIQRMIDDFGEPLVLVSRTFGSYDPATGQKTDTEERIDVFGTVASYDFSEMDLTTVLRGDRKVIFGATDVNGNPISPQPDDRIEGQGDDVSIVSVRQILSSGITVAYICQVRE